MAIEENNINDRIRKDINITRSHYFSEKTNIQCISNSEETKVELYFSDKFKHEKDKEIIPQALVHTIQNLLDETQRILKANDITGLDPLIYLINNSQSSRIKEIAKRLKIDPNTLITEIFNNALENNFDSSLSTVLINLYILGKVSYNEIKDYLDKDSKKVIRDLSDLR